MAKPAILKTTTIILLFLLPFISNAQLVIKMKKINGVYTVPCKVNGRPLSFIFDTGASDVSLSLEEAIKMMNLFGTPSHISNIENDFGKGKQLDFDNLNVSFFEVMSVDPDSNIKVHLKEIQSHLQTESVPEF